MVSCSIIGCPAWGAEPSEEPITWVGKSRRIIFHHTAGHHPEISHPHDESRAEAIKYAQQIQRFHKSQGWIDSGHNFLVCRNGLILQGRWRSIRSIQKGQMVRSAHCPGQNDQIGIEHEHFGDELMTQEQRRSSSRLMAWISDQYDRKKILPVHPHSEFFATSCPANLTREIPTIVRVAQAILDTEGGDR